MNIWNYYGVKPDGVKVSGRFAGTREELLRELAQKQVVLTSLEEVRTKLKEGRYRLPSFFSDIEQLHYLLVAGLPLDAAISSIVKNTRRAAVRKIWGAVLQKIKEGTPFSRALKEAAEEVKFTLPAFYANMIAVGEEVGDIRGALKGLLQHLGFTLEMRKEVRTAFAYPAFLMTASFLTLTFIIAFILPRFSAIYSPEELVQLPWISQAVLGLGQNLADQGPGFYVVLALIASGAIFILQGPAIREKILSCRWYVPYVRGISLQFELSNLFSALGVMLKGGVDLTRALRLSRNVVSSPALSHILDETGQGIKQGRQISHLWSKYAVFPEEVISLVTAGEAGARLPEVFSDIGLRFMEGFKTRVKVLLTFLEPLIIIFLGLVVGVIVVAIMLAVVGMSDIYG
jgi:type II secretory pathway component PulF